MSISSMVIDVADNVDGAEVLEAIRADTRFTLGPAGGHRHAVVLDTPSIDADTAAFDWLRDHPGIRLVTLVQAYLDDESLPAGIAADYL